MIKCEQLREYVIRPSLELLDLYSEDAEELLVFTCATESLGGTYLHQVGGVALGIYQVEPATIHDIWANYISYRKDLMAALNFKLGYAYAPPDHRVITDLIYATVLARLQYRRVPEALPNRNNIDAIWRYYKKYWNTELGKANEIDSLNNYWLYIGS